MSHQALRRSILGAIALASFTAPVFPSDKVTKLIVPFGAGSGVDRYARMFADALSSTTGRSVVVDNRPGASMTIASKAVSTATPNGLTLLFGVVSGHVTNAALNASVPYDSVAGFTPITAIVSGPGYVLVVGRNSPYKTFDQLMTVAKKAPGSISYGSVGPATSPHLVGALLERASGAKLLHVPYKNSALPDVIAGHVDLTFVSPSLVLPLIKNGDLRALAITHPRRIPQLPDTPSYTELGLKDGDLPSLFAIFAPAGMTLDATNQTYAEVLKAIRSKEFADRITEDGSAVEGKMSPTEFKRYLVAEIDRFRSIFKPMGISMD